MKPGDDTLVCGKETGHRGDHAVRARGGWEFWPNDAEPEIVYRKPPRSRAVDLMERARRIAENSTIVASNAQETSIIAAEAALPKSGTQRRRVYDAIRVCGRTDEELSTLLGLPENSIRPRRTELVQDGFILDSGLTRPTRHGNPAIVWIIKE